MKLRKYQRGYLGAQDDTLDERAAQRCAGVHPTLVEYLTGSHVRVEEGGSPVGGFGMDIVTLTTSLALFTYFNSSGKLHARLVTMTPGKANLGVAVGGEQLPDTYTAGKTSVCRMSDTTALVVYLTSGGVVGCRALTVSGSSVTSGAEATFASDGSSIPKVEFFGTNQAVVCYGSSGVKTSTRVLDLSGTTILPAAELVVSDSFGTHMNLSMITAGGASYIVTYRTSTGGGHMRGRVCAVAGSTVTNPGADTAMSASGNTTAFPTDVLMNDATHGILTWDYASSVIRTLPFTANPTTGVITPGTEIDRAALGVQCTGALLSSGFQILNYDGKPSDTAVSAVTQLLDESGPTPPLGLVEIPPEIRLGTSGLSFDHTVTPVEARKFVSVYKDFSVSGYMFVYAGSI